ncbi:MAG: YbgA family protein [Gammaproteobacteria bacterium]|nr:YbgA family protein [Gammaproteobacteria bacterium]
MSRDQTVRRQLGQLVATANKSRMEETAQIYLLQLMVALKKPSCVTSQVNVLQHIQGYLKNVLGKDDKIELVQTIESYRNGLVPLIVSVTLLKYFFQEYTNEYISNSWYITLYPSELCLQNAI